VLVCVCAQWQAKWHAGYWLPDMQRQCWTGWHATHALPLGVVLMFGCVCIFLLPILLLFKHRHNLKSTALKYRFGFIYRPYRCVMHVGMGCFVACIVWLYGRSCLDSSFNCVLSVDTFAPVNDFTMQMIKSKMYVNSIA